MPKLYAKVDSRGRGYITDEDGLVLSKPLSPDLAADIAGRANIAPDLAAAVEYALNEVQALRIQLLMRWYLWNETQAKMWAEKEKSPVVTRLTEVLDEYRRITETEPADAAPRSL